MERFKGITIILLLAFAMLASAVQTKPASVLLQEGLYAEEIEGNLEAAIQVYERILKHFPKDRPVAAKALLHIGLSYEKLGRGEARKAYERVLREYADQPEAVSAARVRLTTLGQQEADQGPVVRQVWADAADPKFTGAPSPDGKYLSYVDWETGDLAIHELATGNNRRLTSEGWEKGWAQHSVFSPDSKYVACRWRSRRGGGLRIIGLDGAERRLIKHPEGITILRPTDWSADGKHILALGGAMWDDSEGAFRFLKILFVSVEDDDVRVLKTIECLPHRKGSGQFRMSLSPDGRYVAYSFPPADNSGKGDIWVFGTDGEPEIQVVEHPADDFALGWAPDGKRVMFASDRTGSMGIWAVEVADGKTQGMPQLLKPEIGRFHPLGLTQKGSYYYGVFSGGSNVYTATFDPQEGNVAGKPVVAIKQYEGSNWAPDWSPDGRYLACVSASPGASPVFLIGSVETGEVRKLSPDLKDFNVHSLRWAPDGRSLLGAGKTQDMSWGVLKIDIETGALTTIVEGPGIFGPNWAADGKTVFYVCNLKTNGRIIRHDLATGEKKELYSASGFISAALALSPDGRQLAFYDIQGGALKVLPATGGQPREMVKVEGKITFAWTPDGNQLVYGSRGLGEGPAQLWRIPTEGGEPQRLDLEMAYLGHLRFHPDGQQITFMDKAEKDKCEVWVMENFLPEPEKALGMAVREVMALKVLFNALATAVEHEEPDTALTLIDRLTEQGRELQSMVKGTRVEVAVRSGLEMLASLRDALVKRQMDRAKSLTDALNQIGPAIESALEKEAKAEPLGQVIFLPDADTEKGVVLDLASGELLNAGKGDHQLVGTFAELGEGDLAWDRVLICLRGATAKVWRNDTLAELKIEGRIEDATAYKLENIPSRLRVTTAEGNNYEVTVTALHDYGITLKYVETKADPDRK